eukprot:c24614_g1_i1 orf=60-1028(+)
MEPVMLEGAGVVHTSWNYCGDRMVAGTAEGVLQIWDEDTTGSRALACTSTWKAHAGPVVRVVWAPPVFGDVVASCSMDGTISMWEEIEEGSLPCSWRLCANLKEYSTPVLDIQFGNCSGLKLVAAYADGFVRVYETLDILGLKQWQLQAQFQNVTDLSGKFGVCTFSSASISWRPPVHGIQQPVFAVGYRSTALQFAVAKVWEFIEVHQRWNCTVELTAPDELNMPVNYISWAPNIGRPYELIAVASGNGVSIWNIDFSTVSHGSISPKRVARLNGFESEVLQVEWDISGMTLATSGSDGVVRLWQANFNGEWRQQARVEGN